MEKKALYLMISRTEGGMGRLIRSFTNYQYNHVSLTLDPTLRSWVSFARYYRDAPLYGGYITESAERFLAEGHHVSVRIFRLDIPEEKHDRLEKLFSLAGNPNSGIIYNTFDALATPIGHKINIKNAYTCLGFACLVLGRRFRNIKELDSYLSPHLIYEGDLAHLVHDSGRRDDMYFTRIGFLSGLRHTAWQMARLSARSIKR